MTSIGNLRIVVVATVLATVVMVLAHAGEGEAVPLGQNGRIAFTSSRVTTDNPTGDREIFTTRPDGTGLKQLTFNTTNDFHPTYSPNGARIAYNGWDGNNYAILTIPASGGTPTSVTDTSGASDLSYSPNGQRIAYQASDGNDEEIYTIPASGGSAFNVTNNATHDYEPDYSPSGRRIAYAGSDGEIYTISISGGPPFNVTNNPGGGADDPDYSPNGQRIAYAGYDGNNKEIYTIPASGGVPTNLTGVVDRDAYPAWSPDGTKIAFESNGEIYTMNASDGTNQTNITNTPASEQFPGWQPNTAPSITGLRPSPGSRLLDRTPTLRAVVRDTQTDLAHPDITLYLDGRAKPFSYNRATNGLSYATGRLSFGKHAVRIVAGDDVGLSRTESWRFRVVR